METPAMDALLKNNVWHGIPLYDATPDEILKDARSELAALKRELAVHERALAISVDAADDFHAKPEWIERFIEQARSETK